jgi:hypothetical protein
MPDGMRWWHYAVGYGFVLLTQGASPWLGIHHTSRALWNSVAISGDKRNEAPSSNRRAAGSVSLSDSNIGGTRRVHWRVASSQGGRIVERMAEPEDGAGMVSSLSDRFGAFARLWRGRGIRHAPPRDLPIHLSCDCCGVLALHLAVYVWAKHPGQTISKS